MRTPQRTLPTAYGLRLASAPRTIVYISDQEMRLLIDALMAKAAEAAKAGRTDSAERMIRRVRTLQEMARS